MDGQDGGKSCSSCLSMFEFLVATQPQRGDTNIQQSRRNPRPHVPPRWGLNCFLACEPGALHRAIAFRPVGASREFFPMTKHEGRVRLFKPSPRSSAPLRPPRPPRLPPKIRVDSCSFAVTQNYVLVLFGETPAGFFHCCHGDPR